MKCGAERTVHKVNKFEEKFKEKISTWKNNSLPDLHIDILRVLYNNNGKKLSAHEIALEVDKHHFAITKAMEKLVSQKYASYTTNGKRYYYIKEQAISKFFEE